MQKCTKKYTKATKVRKAAARFADVILSIRSCSATTTFLFRNMPSRRGGRSGGSASRENEVLQEGIYDWFCACVPPSAAKIPDYHHPGCPWPRGRFQRGSPCPAALSPFCRSLVPQVLAARYFPCNEHLLPHGPCYSPASLRWRSCGCATCGSLC